MFAPAFPLFTRLVAAATPLDVLASGFLVTHVQFLVGLLLEDAARQVYRRLGFADQYSYHYRQPP